MAVHCRGYWEEGDLFSKSMEIPRDIRRALIIFKAKDRFTGGG